MQRSGKVPEKLLSYLDAFSDGNIYHGDTNHVFCGVGGDLEVFSQAAKSARPSKGSFDNPPFGQHLEALGWFSGYIESQPQQVFDKFNRGIAVSLVAAEGFYRIRLVHDFDHRLPILGWYRRYGRRVLGR